MLVREVICDAKTGKRTERMTEMPGVITESEAKERDRRAAIAEQNAAIYAQLAANDLKIIRAFVENDLDRIAKHAEAQEALRAQLK